MPLVTAKMMMGLSDYRSAKVHIAWYLILAVCAFPLLGAHLHAVESHHAAGPHPLDPELHFHSYSHHESIDTVAAPAGDDLVVELEGESLLQQILKIFQQGVFLALLPLAGTALRPKFPSTYTAPFRPRPPTLYQRQPRAPPGY